MVHIGCHKQDMEQGDLHILKCDAAEESPLKGGEGRIAPDVTAARKTHAVDEAIAVVTGVMAHRSEHSESRIWDTSKRMQSKMTYSCFVVTPLKSPGLRVVRAPLRWISLR